MSRIRQETIWQHQLVLPYILTELKSKVDAISPVAKIYLHGSRARTASQDWKKLEGKDWDIIMVCGFPIVNTAVWTLDKNYHIDLSVTTHSQMEKFKTYNRCLIELFPNYSLKEI